MKIVVLAGGTSTERDVSLSSGNGVYNALKEKGHEVVLIDLYLGYETEAPLTDLFASQYNCCGDIQSVTEQTPDIEELRKLRKDGGKSIFGPNVLALCDMADIVFMALHGSNGEDGRIQATFDLMGIKYTGTGYLSSAVSMDKGITKQFFHAHNVPTPVGITLKKGDVVDNRLEVLYPKGDEEIEHRTKNMNARQQEIDEEDATGFIFDNFGDFMSCRNLESVYTKSEYPDISFDAFLPFWEKQMKF